MLPLGPRAAVVVTGIGAVTPLGQRRWPGTWAAPRGGRVGRAADHLLRPVPAHQPHRRRGAGPRRLRGPRPQGAAAHRPLHPVRAASRRGRRWPRPACRPASRAPWPRRRARCRRRAWAARARSSSRSPSRPPAAPTASARSSSPWPSATWPPARSPSSSGRRGRRYAPVSACASGGHAIGEGAEIILRGDAEMMIAGGSEAPIFEAFVGAFAAMRALSTRNDDPAGASRPFDQGRDGFVAAEGAAMLVLEEAGHAQRRDVPDPRRGGRVRRHVRCGPRDAARARAARAPCGRPGGRPGQGRACRRPPSTRSARMPPARRKATRPSWRPSGRSSASTGPASASPPRRAPSATPSARRAPSGPS